MNVKTTILGWSCATVLTLASGCTGSGPAAPAETPTATTAATGMAASGAADAKVRTALAGDVRTDKERARDGARHPAETLAFIGVRDDAAVLELWPGGGYYTSILAPVLAERGKLTVTYNKPANGGEEPAIVTRLSKNPEVFNKVGKQLLDLPNVNLGPSASFDFVLTFRNIHNWIDGGYAEKVFAESFRVLKPGGVLGIEEHRGNPGMSVEAIKKNGYVPEETVRKLAEQAGFRFVARSEVNANPKDTKDHPNGVWSLPPTLAGKDVDRDKYLAIGESDRMTLRFVKP